jgi:hypothetical protein
MSRRVRVSANDGQGQKAWTPSYRSAGRKGNFAEAEARNKEKFTQPRISQMLLIRVIREHYKLTSTAFDTDK